MAPPLGFVFSSDAPVSADQAMSTGANASFTSKTSMSPTPRPALASPCSVAGMGAVRMNTGPLDRRLRGHQDGGGAVGDLGRGRRRDLPALAQRRQRGHLLQRGVAARALVHADPVDRGGLPLAPAPPAATPRSNRPSSMARTAR